MSSLREKGVSESDKKCVPSTNEQCELRKPFEYNNRYAHRLNEFRPMTLTLAQDLLADHKIYLVNTYEECQEAMKEFKLRLREYDVLGIDAEWKMSSRGRRRVALLQLASQHGLCALIRLCKIYRIPEELEEILGNHKILKVGVESKSDGDFIYKDYGIRVTSTFDLRYMAAMCGLKPGGLAIMANDHLLYKVSKNKKTQCSDWEIENLSDKQINYAALDAIIGYKLFLYYSSFQNRINNCNISLFFNKFYVHPNGMLIYEDCSRSNS